MQYAFLGYCDQSRKKNEKMGKNEKRHPAFSILLQVEEALLSHPVTKRRKKVEALRCGEVRALERIFPEQFCGAGHFVGSFGDVKTDNVPEIRVEDAHPVSPVIRQGNF
ncbi:MAG: hypothetical protein WC406_04300 [Methanoregula sp.]